MKNIKTWLAPFLLLTITITVMSCQKEAVYTKTADEEIAAVSNHGPVVRAYRDSFDADLHFKPDIAAGWTSGSSPAWFYGSSFGNATHMGNANTYFNTYTLKNSAGVTIVYGRPVNMFYASQLQSFNVPSDVHYVIFDDKGNSIWCKIAPEGLPSWHTDPTHVAMSGTVFIVGGTGKFTRATGETTLNGAFNQLNLHECSMWQNGWISY